MFYGHKTVYAALVKNQLSAVDFVAQAPLSLSPALFQAARLQA